MAPHYRNKLKEITMYVSDTMLNHDRMYEVAEANPYKGVKAGNCNVTQCQKWGASSWNDATKAWYCESCATEIKKFSNGLFEVFINKDNHFDYDTEVFVKKVLSYQGKIKESKKPILQFKRYGEKLGRNSLCSCGSGIKYKKCCIK